MRTFTINSKNHGVVEFTANEGRTYTYVWCSLDGGARFQPCEGGGTMGTTLTVHAKEDLERVCRGWWRQFLKGQKGH